MRTSRAAQSGQIRANEAGLPPPLPPCAPLAHRPVPAHVPGSTTIYLPRTDQSRTALGRGRERREGEVQRRGCHSIRVRPPLAKTTQGRRGPRARRLPSLSPPLCVEPGCVTQSGRAARRLWAGRASPGLPRESAAVGLASNELIERVNPRVRNPLRSFLLGGGGSVFATARAWGAQRSRNAAREKEGRRLDFALCRNTGRPALQQQRQPIANAAHAVAGCSSPGPTAFVALRLCHLSGGRTPFHFSVFPRSSPTRPSVACTFLYILLYLFLTSSPISNWREGVVAPPVRLLIPQC